MANIEVDSRNVLKMFAELSNKNQKKVHRIALAKALSILVKEARSTLKGVIRKSIYSKSKKTGRSLASGIKYRINKEATEGKAHILGDFRLKFFELGTNIRFNKQKGRIKLKAKRYTGNIKPTNFFTTAKQQTQQQVFDSIKKNMEDTIIKINNKYKK